MGLSKGRTNNPNGRPRGVANKITASVRENIQNLFDDNWPLIVEDFKQLKGLERITMMEKYLSYIAPKLSSIDANVDVQSKLNGLTDNQLSQLIEKIINETGNQD